MSLIITYIGSKGCVMVGDKRRIGFYGGPSGNREKLEEGLYNGKIETLEQLKSDAEKLGISLKVSDDADKISEIGDVLVGEVRSKSSTETKRKRIYATTGAYSLIELSGSHMQTMKTGGTSIVVFGNKYTKELAEKIINKQWKTKITLKEIGNIFEGVMTEVASKTPSVSREYELRSKYPVIDIKAAKELLRTTIIKDVEELEKYRNGLRDEQIKTSQNIRMATKIVIQGAVGNVSYVKGNNVGVILDKGLDALDTKWKTIACEGEIINMTVDDPSNVEVGDLAVIENETLCINRTTEGLKCDFIICRNK